jgi:hypothetical protein
METLRYTGFCEEASFLESPAPSAEFAVDQTSASLDSGTDTQIIYEGSLGRGPRIHRPGFYTVEGDIEYAFDIRTIGWLLKWALEGYVYTADGIHELYGTDERELPSFCARLGKDKLDGTNFEHVFSGCTIGSLELSLSDGYTTAKAAINAAKDATGTLLSRTAVEALLPDEYPLVFHEVTMTRGDGAEDISTLVKGLTLSINNNLSPDAGRHIGSRFGARIPAGAREISLGIDMYYEDLDTLELLWGDSSGPSDDGTTETSIAITFDAGDDGNMVISVPRYVITAVPIQPSAKDEIEMSTEGMAMTDTIELADGVTDVYSELLVTLTNDSDEMAVSS